MRASFLVDAPLLPSLFHDWTKFLPSEWCAYVDNFYNKDGSKKPHEETEAFSAAWNSHQKRNPHHWQYYVLLQDKGDLIPLEMPEKYAREMLADWIGAGLAINGKNDVHFWYYKNKENIKLHPNTRKFIEKLLSDLKFSLSSEDKIINMIAEEPKKFISMIKNNVVEANSLTYAAEHLWKIKPKKSLRILFDLLENKDKAVVEGAICGISNLVSWAKFPTEVLQEISEKLISLKKRTKSEALQTCCDDALENITPYI